MCRRLTSMPKQSAHSDESIIIIIIIISRSHNNENMKEKREWREVKYRVSLGTQ